MFATGIPIVTNLKILCPDSLAGGVIDRHIAISQHEETYYEDTSHYSGTDCIAVSSSLYNAVIF
jgi:hypothetical protein